MARFPKSEAKTLTLAQTITSGMAPAGEEPNPVYPDPPVPSADLLNLAAAYQIARDQAITAQAEAEQATSEKDAKLAELIEAMKKDIRYAENTVDFDDEKLKLIGWSAPRPRTPLTAPGQSRLLEAKLQGEGDLTLSWRAPVEGGKPSAYRIMRRQRPEGPWSDVGTAVATEIAMTDQPRGIEFEYRIVAVNRVGEGEPSNTVVVVL